MSNAYYKRAAGGEAPAMQEWCRRPGKRDENGDLVYVTQQSEKEKCDINHIIRRFTRTGVIDRVSKFEARFGDTRGVDFTDAMNLVTHAQQAFEELPSKIRKRFSNDPGKLLEFMENPNNRDEAIELGLINQRWTPETDGLGEHVQEGKNVLTDAE